MAKKRPNKAEREYMTKVAAYGCIACEKDGLVRPAEIRTRTTGDIALEDGFGNLVLNGTDGSSTNAGDNMDLEGATGITI